MAKVGGSQRTKMGDYKKYCRQLTALLTSWFSISDLKVWTGLEHFLLDISNWTFPQYISPNILPFITYPAQSISMRKCIILAM